MGERTGNCVRWHIIFEGDVQFVGFRYTAMLIAKRLGLTGWVRNLSDGRVDAEVQGAVSNLRRFLMQLKSHPPIHISHYTVTEIDPDPSERRFAVRDGLS